MRLILEVFSVCFHHCFLVHTIIPKFNMSRGIECNGYSLTLVIFIISMAWYKLQQLQCVSNGSLSRYAKLQVRMRGECRERFSRHRRLAIPTCITARASRTCRDACRDRQLAVSFENGGRGELSRHSRRMRNLQYYVSGKRPMELLINKFSSLNEGVEYRLQPCVRLSNPLNNI